MLRFRAGSARTPYGYGPVDRPHGFNRDTFAKQRTYMIHDKQVWTLEQTRLTQETIFEFLREAISTPGS